MKPQLILVLSLYLVSGSVFLFGSNPESLSAEKFYPGCFHLTEFPQLTDCVKKYYQYKRNVIGIAAGKEYFIYDEFNQHIEKFDHFDSWVNAVRKLNIGPLPTKDYGITLSQINNPKFLNLLGFDYIDKGYKVNDYIFGEGETYYFFVYNMANRRTTKFRTQKEWEGNIALNGLTPLVTRWHQTNYSLFRESVKWVKENASLSIFGLILLLLVNALLLPSIFASESKGYKVGIILFGITELILIFLFSIASFPYSF